MSKNIIIESRENYIMNELNALKKNIEAMTFNQPPSVERIPATRYPVGSTYPVLSMEMIIVTTTFTPLLGQTLLGTVESDLFHTTLDANGIYPLGANWTGIIGDVRYETWNSASYSDGKNIKYMQGFFNGTASTINAIWYQTFRGFKYVS